MQPSRVPLLLTLLLEPSMVKSQQTTGSKIVFPPTTNGSRIGIRTDGWPVKDGNLVELDPSTRFNNARFEAQKPIRSGI